jgi:nucleotide-binding universal stress UspA family protein
MAGFQRILVPVDGSEGSEGACAFASDLAAATGAAITLMHVVEVSSAAAGPTLARARALLPEGVAVDEVVSAGHAADEILAWAHQHRPSVIVVGSRGLGPLQELLLGSVSDKVVRRAQVPVTVAR